MQLAPRTNDPDDKLVGVVDKPELQAAPGVERMFREIYERVQPHALRHAETVLSKDEARDAFYNALQRAWSLWHTLQPEQMNDGYIYRAVKREVLAMKRRNDRSVSIGDVDAELTQHAIQDIAQFTRATTADEVLDMAIAAMPPRRREVMLLLQRFHLTYEEIGEQLDMSLGTVKTHLRLANEDIRLAFRAAGFKLAKPNASRKGFVLLPRGESEVTNG